MSVRNCPNESRLQNYPALSNPKAAIERHLKVPCRVSSHTAHAMGFHTTRKFYEKSKLQITNFDINQSKQTFYFTMMLINLRKTPDLRSAIIAHTVITPEKFIRSIPYVLKIDKISHCATQQTRWIRIA